MEKKLVEIAVTDGRHTKKLLWAKYGLPKFIHRSPNPYYLQL